MTQITLGTYAANIYPNGQDGDSWLVIWVNIHKDGYQQVLHNAPSKTYTSFERAKRFAEKKLNEIAK